MDEPKHTLPASSGTTPSPADQLQPDNLNSATSTPNRRRGQHFGLGQTGSFRPHTGDADSWTKLAAAVADGDREQVFQLAVQWVQSPITQTGDGEKLLSLPAVAAALTCGTRTVWRLVARKELAAPLHVGGGARWLRKDVQQYLAQSKAKRGKRRR
jgi:predicted DNA-binding transcriptional regulator AlpA